MGAGLRPGAKATELSPDPTVRALNLYPDTRMHGSTGGAGEGAFYGNRFTAALGKPRDLSPVSPTVRHLASSLPNRDPRRHVMALRA